MQINFRFHIFDIFFDHIYRLLKDVQVIYVILVNERHQITIKTSRNVGKDDILNHDIKHTNINRQIFLLLFDGKNDRMNGRR